MQRIVIHEIEKDGNIEKIVNYQVTYPKGDLKEAAKKEFKNYKPGKKKQVLVFNSENKLIYTFKNFN